MRAHWVLLFHLRIFPHPPPSTRTITATTPPTTPPAPAPIVETLRSSPAFSARHPSSARIRARTPRPGPPSARAPGRSTSRPGSFRKTELPGGLLLGHPGNPPGEHYDIEEKKPDRNGYVQKKRRSVAHPAVTGWRMVCQVRKPPRLPASPGEFNPACCERPAAKPAGMEIFHYGIDLPGDLRAVVCLAAPVADVCRDVPDDDDLIPDPCNELGLSFLQGSFTEGTSLWNHSVPSSEVPGKIVGIDLRQFQNPTKRADLQFVVQRDDCSNLAAGRHL